MSSNLAPRDWGTIAPAAFIYWLFWNVLAAAILALWFAGILQTSVPQWFFWLGFMPAELVGAFLMKGWTGRSGWTLSEWMYCLPWPARYLWALVLMGSAVFIVHPIVGVYGMVVLVVHWVSKGTSPIDRMFHE